MQEKSKELEIWIPQKKIKPYESSFLRSNFMLK